MKTLAIVGIGYWGKNIIREFNKLAKIKYACSTGNKSNKNWLNQNYPDIKWTKNFNEILNDKTVDAIIICTPISTHYDYSKLSLEYGKHVFVEKPVTENSQDSIKLLELAKKKILIIFVGHIFLYSEIFKKIRSISKKENIKKIILDWKKCGTFNEKITLNLLTHEISIILEILGNPKKIYYNDYPNDKNNISIIATYNSKICSINISRISNLKKKTVTVFTEENIYVWDDNELLKFNKKRKLFENYHTSKKSPLEIECQEFISILSKNIPNYDSINLGININKIIENLGEI